MGGRNWAGTNDSQKPPVDVDRLGPKMISETQGGINRLGKKLLKVGKRWGALGNARTARLEGQYHVSGRGETRGIFGVKRT